MHQKLKKMLTRKISKDHVWIYRQWSLSIGILFFWFLFFYSEKRLVQRSTKHALDKSEFLVMYDILPSERTVVTSLIKTQYGSSVPVTI